MAIRRGKGRGASEERWLEVDATMTGTLAFKDPVNLSINGRFEGTLDTKGNLSVGEQAQVTATINGERIIIGGRVHGTVLATGLVEVLASGRIHGKIQTPRLIVHDGATVHGTLEMEGSPSESQWMTIDELARYLEVDVSTVTQWAQEGRVPGQHEGGAWRFERARVEAWVAQEKIK